MPSRSTQQRSDRTSGPPSPRLRRGSLRVALRCERRLVGVRVRDDDGRRHRGRRHLRPRARLRRDGIAVDSRERIISALRKLTKILVAIVILGCVALAPPPVFGAAASASVTQAEAESFVTSFYRDLEGDNLDKVMAHFDQTVVYYNFGAKDLAFVANDLGQYCAYFPSRSFSVSAVTLNPLPNSDRVTVKFDLRFFIRSPERDTTRSGRARVEMDLVKRDGALKITRFNGTAVTEPAGSPSK